MIDHIQVLASHSRGLVLHLDARGLRKLKGEPDDWHEQEVGGTRLPILARRGMSAQREAEVWSRPETLLFDYEGHWEDDERTVLLLAPMQRNWKGRYPDWERFTMPVCSAGTFVTVRRVVA